MVGLLDVAVSIHRQKVVLDRVDFPYGERQLNISRTSRRESLTSHNRLSDRSQLLPEIAPALPHGFSEQLGVLLSCSTDVVIVADESESVRLLPASEEAY